MIFFSDLMVPILYLYSFVVLWYEVSRGTPVLSIPTADVVEALKEFSINTKSFRYDLKKK